MSRPGVNQGLECNFIKVILTKNQERSKKDKEGVRIKKSRYVELDRTHCCTEKFNIALSLYRVLRVTFYFSEGFSKAATEVLWSLRVTMICFLKQESSLWSLTP